MSSNEQEQAVLIFSKIPLIMGEIGSISKNKRTTGGGQNWAFRGVDDVMNHLNPLLSKHGVFVTPGKILDSQSKEVVTARGTTGTHVVNTYEFVFYASDGSFITAQSKGEAIDYGDKANGKAASYAYKTVMLQTFSIPTEDMEDPDATVHETIKKQPINNNQNNRQSTPDEYVVPFGKWKGTKLTDHQEAEILNYVKYLVDQNKGKTMNSSVQEFIAMAGKLLRD